jgi:protein NrfD
MTKSNRTWKRIFWIVAIIGFVIGLYGLYNRLMSGHVNTDYGSYVPWGLWVAAYTMLIGASAGAFVIAAVIYIRRAEDWYPVARTALIVALATFIGGMTSIWIDLGHSMRFINLYISTNFFSMMGIMAWLYLIYGLMLIAMIDLSWVSERKRWLRRLSYMAVPFAIMFAGAEGALFGVVGAKSLWESGLTPVLFLVEGALAGTAAVIVGAFLFNQLDQAKAAYLGRIMLGLITTVLILEWSDYSVTLFSGIPATADAVRSVLFGQYWYVFWIIHLLFGMLIPLLLLAIRPNNILAVTGSAALIIGTAIATKLNLIIPAQAQAEIEGLEAAFTGPGLTFSYFPTVPEWALFIWIGSLAVILVLGGEALLVWLSSRNILPHWGGHAAPSEIAGD